jgi:serine/threonine protein kinase
MRDLFDQATNLPTDERRTFVDRASVDDQGLRDELLSLVESDKCQSKKPLTDAIGNAISGTMEARRQRLVGSKVGSYKLLRVIGYGGVGTVYLGQHVESEGRAPVAIKIVERAALHTDTRRRFEIEKQILANLDHPRIARIFDAGDTQEAFPYLVMEHVHGDSIDRYCDRRRLNVRSRLLIFLQVCEALQYAHTHLVIHRDLKPANILVTLDGDVKLLDFGIAKLLDPDTGSAIALTRLQDQLLTPEYASPEQIHGQYLTTASDIYALGVLLHELLTGCRPYGTPATQLELERAICVEEPKKPSRITRPPRTIKVGKSTTSDESQIRAALRGTTPPRLSHQLSGDLDAIILRALRKDAAERYESVHDLAEDLRSYLACRPVSTARSTNIYLASRFLRRNCFLIAIGLSIAIATAFAISGIRSMSIAMAEQRDRAYHSRKAADAVTEFMVSAFDSTNNSEKRNDSALDLIDRATQLIKVDTQQDPTIRAKLLESIGHYQSRLGRTTEGVRLLKEAVAIRQTDDGTRTSDLATLYLRLGSAQSNTSEFEEAKRALQYSRTLLVQEQRSNSTEFALVTVRLGIVEMELGNSSKAVRLLTEALALSERIYGAGHSEVASASAALANALRWAGKYRESTRFARAALTIYERTVPELHPDRIGTLQTLAAGQVSIGELASAMTNTQLAYKSASRLSKGNAAMFIDPLQEASTSFGALGALDLAEKIQREVLDLSTIHRGTLSIPTAYGRETLGIILWKRKQFVAAERELRAALASYKLLLPDDHPYISTSEHWISEALLAQNKVESAANQLRVTLQRLNRTEAAPWRVARTVSTLGYSLFKQNRIDEAIRLMEQGINTLSAVEVQDPSTLTLARSRLREVYLATGNTEKLEKLDASIQKKKSEGATRL